MNRIELLIVSSVQVDYLKAPVNWYFGMFPLFQSQVYLKTSMFPVPSLFKNLLLMLWYIRLPGNVQQVGCMHDASSLNE